MWPHLKMPSVPISTDAPAAGFPGLCTQFCIKNNELFIENDEICIKNDEICIENDELCIENVMRHGSERR